MQPAASPELANVGAVYLEECRISTDVRPYARDQRRAVQLWVISETLCDTGGSPEAVASNVGSERNPPIT